MSLHTAGTALCYLTDLPPEIRLIVYEFLWPAIDTGTTFTVTQAGLALDTAHHISPPNLDLLQTCKLLRSEARPVYFAHTDLGLVPVDSFLAKSSHG